VQRVPGRNHLLLQIILPVKRKLYSSGLFSFTFKDHTKDVSKSIKALFLRKIKKYGETEL